MEYAEQIKTKLDLEGQNLTKKIRILKDFDTKRIIESLPNLEAAFEKAMSEEAAFKNESAGFIASPSGDCAEVKRIVAFLSMQYTPENGERKTEKDREAWLLLQRNDNNDLRGAITRQRGVSFEVENLRIATEMAKKKLEDTGRVLALKIAQIQFLTESTLRG